MNTNETTILIARAVYAAQKFPGVRVEATGETFAIDAPVKDMDRTGLTLETLIPNVESVVWELQELYGEHAERL